MQLNELTAVSPVDGRYHSKTSLLSAYFSEYALMKYRLKVEIEYFIALCEIPLPQLSSFDKARFAQLRAIYEDFDVNGAMRIKAIEEVTNHDVKAIEYYIKEQLDSFGDYEAFKEFIHFGLTSQDINNTSFPMMLKDSLVNEYLPLLEKIISQLHAYAEEWKDVPMLAKTHGQPASPTRLGKEIMVFAYRLNKLCVELKEIILPSISGKFGGATGNFNAHNVAYNDIDWKAFGHDFLINSLGLRREEWTTQISNYDNFAQVFDALKRIHTVLIDLDRDVWQYISMGYFKQKIKKGEVGSSAMPYKVNPIDFENSEGNLGIANAILEFLSRKLPISRLQRDLTDSTVIRNIGVPLGHAIIAFQSTLKGLNKIVLHNEALQSDLHDNWSVVAEAIQTILRREGFPNPYEALKGLTRTNETVDQNSISNFIDTLNVSDAIKAELKQITPYNYIGI